MKEEQGGDTVLLFFLFYYFIIFFLVERRRRRCEEKNNQSINHSEKPTNHQVIFINKSLVRGINRKELGIYKLICNVLFLNS